MEIIVMKRSVEFVRIVIGRNRSTELYCSYEYSISMGDAQAKLCILIQMGDLFPALP